MLTQTAGLFDFPLPQREASWAISAPLVPMNFRLLLVLAALAPGCFAAEPTIAIPFTLDEPGFVTLVIEDATGRRVRNLISETEFPAGKNVAHWDGLDDLGRDVDAGKHAIRHIPGKLVAPGKFSVRGLVRPRLELTYELTAYARGNPPWMTKDRASGWLTNHSAPSTVLFVPPGGAPIREGKPTSSGGQLLVGSWVSEGGSGLAWLDTDGNKLHGQEWVGGVWTGVTHFARDAGANAVAGVYAYAAAPWDDELRIAELVTEATPQPSDARMGTGGDRPLLTPVWKFDGPERFNDHTNLRGLGGLSVHNGLLVASLHTHNRLLFVDARARKPLGTAALDAPGGLAFDVKGRLLAISGKRLLRFTIPADLQPHLDAQASPLPVETLIDSGLEEPQQIALDAQGNIFISDRGASHQVKVFGADGKFSRAIGEAGGPALGLYNSRRMQNPNGLTVTNDNRVWVAETDRTPKRLSVWELNGEFVRAFYGPPAYGGGGYLDGEDATRFFYADDGGGMELKLDWEKGTSEPAAVYYRPELDSLKPASRFAPPETPLHFQRRTYLTNAHNSNPTGGVPTAGLWLLEGGIARPVAMIGQANDWGVVNEAAQFSVRWIGEAEPTATGPHTFTVSAPSGVRLWIDGVKVLDRWRQSGKDDQVRVALAAGKRCAIRMEYRQAQGRAVARLRWSSDGAAPLVIAPPDGFKAEYFSDTELARPIETRTDKAIDFDFTASGLKLTRANPFAARLPKDATFEKDQILFAWSDVNGNGAVDPAEVTMQSGASGSVNIQSDLSVVTGGGLSLRPTAFTRAGTPLYDIATATQLGPETQSPVSSGGGQALVDRAGRFVFTTAPKPFSPFGVGGGADGEATWSYPSLWPGLHASHNAPMPVHPGELIGTTRLLGGTVLPRGSDAGEIWAINGNKGNVYLFTTDGLFVATLFKDSRTASWDFPEATHGMSVGDASLHEENFWPAIAQLSDGSIYVISNSNLIRIDGLEGVRRIHASAIDVTAEMLARTQRHSLRAE